MRTIAPALALLVGALSAIVADTAAAVERLSDEVRTVRGVDRPLGLSGRGNEAVLALLQDAERELRAGRPEQASVALERALRIEPRNPTVWHYLGLARLDLGDYSQAEVMASRSHSLAPADRALRAYNARLVAAARQASGQTGAPLPDGLETWASPDEPVQRQASSRPSFRDIETWRSPDSFATATAPPSSYTDSGDGRQRPYRAEQRRRPAPVEAQEPVEARTPAWRARADSGTDRVRRESTPLRRECRIWYPDRPPNRQPPPFKCDEGTRHVPPGAVLLVSI
ncbi:MAG TPA: tetratricopeptide repeat protein [Gammaproteobacteria bacterium]|nr:tetratricopeptide repeat protein [Gammaproteobacteria bacterium]